MKPNRFVLVLYFFVFSFLLSGWGYYPEKPEKQTPKVPSCSVIIFDEPHTDFFVNIYGEGSKQACGALYRMALDRSWPVTHRKYVVITSPVYCIHETESLRYEIVTLGWDTSMAKRFCNLDLIN